MAWFDKAMCPDKARTVVAAVVSLHGENGVLLRRTLPLFLLDWPPHALGLFTSRPTFGVHCIKLSSRNVLCPLAALPLSLSTPAVSPSTPAGGCCRCRRCHTLILTSTRTLALLPSLALAIASRGNTALPFPPLVVESPVSRLHWSSASTSTPFYAESAPECIRPGVDPMSARGFLVQSRTTCVLWPEIIARLTPQ